MTFALRNYQEECLTFTRLALDKYERVANVLPTGAGKTVIFAQMALRHLKENGDGRVLVLVHTDELVQQAYDKIRITLIGQGISLGIVKAERDDVTAQVIVGSVQTLRSEVRRRRVSGVTQMIVDECFPAGTRVGAKAIEDLRPGDLVPSWDEETGYEVLRPVVALMKRKPAAIRRIDFEDGTSVTCTPNHPLLTPAGWCPAGGLWRGASVLSFTHDATADGGDLYGMLDDGESCGAAEASTGHVPQDRAGVLLGSVPGLVGEPSIVRTNGSDEPEARFEAHEGAQPDGSGGAAGEDEGDSSGDRPQTAGAGWQWEADARAAEALGCAPGLAYGGYFGSDGRTDALALQAGYRAPDDEGVRGGGRGVPLLAGPPILRPAPGRTVVERRVARIQVLEPGSDGTYGGVCADGFVYNIEVAGTHTYLVGDGGVVAHNCHHATAQSYRSIIEHYSQVQRCKACGSFGVESDMITTCTECRGVRGVPACKVVGFTATLARSDDGDLSKVWQTVAYRRDILWMIRNEYLIDVRGLHVRVDDLDLKKVKKSGGDFQKDALGQALSDSMAPEVVAKALREHGPDRQTICFAPLVATAYEFEKAFLAAGFTAETVHGQLPKGERRAILARYASGETQVLCNAMVLTEGFDAPTTSCVIVARPTKSKPLFQQMVGRGLRVDPERPWAEQDCLVMVVAGAEMHDLRSLVDLTEKKINPKPDQTLLEAEDEQEREGAARAGKPMWKGPTKVKEFDPLLRASRRTWGHTAGSGARYLAAGDYYIVLQESAETPGAWDVCWANKIMPWDRYAKPLHDRTEYTGLPLDLAMDWGEDVADRMGGESSSMFNTKSKSWRSGKDISPGFQRLARSLKVPFELGVTRKGELSDAVNQALASQRLDPMVTTYREYLKIKESEGS